MTELALDPHLTKPDRSLYEQQRRTHAGQAHWAGSGPPGMTCRQCAWWQSKHDYYANGNGLKPSPCAKFTRLTGGQRGKPVPHNAGACRHFEESAAPPAVVPK